MQESKSVTSYTSFVLIVFIILTIPAEVFAHKVMVFAWVDGNTVYTESKFNGGRKVKAGQVNVFDSTGKELLSGITDDNGEFSFKIPQKTDLRIELLAGTGHRGEWTIKADEIEVDKTDVTEPANILESKSEPEPQIVTKTVDKDNQTELNSSEIQIMLEKTLDKKLKPVLRMLATLQEKGPSINDIFGGIGYILGLMGIAMYFKAKQVKGK